LPLALFENREDAAWLLLGFLLFAASWGLSIISLGLADGHVRLTVVAPLVALLLFGAAVLEGGLRRLHTQLTGRRLLPWPIGLVSLSTLTRAILPSTMAEAAGRVGLNGRLVAGLIYTILAADAIALTLLLG
jgi:hypothetical protein